MKRNPLSIDEELQVICLRDELRRNLLRDDPAAKSKVAWALVHNEALRIILLKRKREGSAKGGDRTRRNRKAPTLEELIRAALAKNIDPKSYVADWVRFSGLSRSAVYRRISKVVEAKK